MCPIDPQSDATHVGLNADRWVTICKGDSLDIVCEIVPDTVIPEFAPSGHVFDEVRVVGTVHVIYSSIEEPPASSLSKEPMLNEKVHVQLMKLCELLTETATPIRVPRVWL